MIPLFTLDGIAMIMREVNRTIELTRGTQSQATRDEWDKRLLEFSKPLHDWIVEGLAKMAEETGRA